MLREKIKEIQNTEYYDSSFYSGETGLKNADEYFSRVADSILSAVLEELPKDKLELPANDLDNLEVKGYNNAIAEIREILKGVKG